MTTTETPFPTLTELLFEAGPGQHTEALTALGRAQRLAEGDSEAPEFVVLVVGNDESEEAVTVSGYVKEDFLQRLNEDPTVALAAEPQIISDESSLTLYASALAFGLIDAAIQAGNDGSESEAFETMQDAVVQTSQSPTASVAVISILLAVLANLADHDPNGFTEIVTRTALKAAEAHG